MGAENEPGNAEQKRRVARIRAEIAEEREQAEALARCFRFGDLEHTIRSRVERVRFLEDQLLRGGPVLVLGCDPGIRHFGWAVVDIDGGKRRIVEAGTINTEAKLPVTERVALIAAGLEHPLRLVTLVSVEQQTRAYQGHQERGDTNANARLAMGVGFIPMTLAATAGVRCIEVTPQLAKAALGVGSRATKHQVGAAVSRMRGCPKRLSQHAADAVGIACAGAMRARRIG